MIKVNDKFQYLFSKKIVTVRKIEKERKETFVYFSPAGCLPISELEGSIKSGLIIKI